MVLNSRPTGNSTYKIYDLLGIKLLIKLWLLIRLWLGFSHILKHKLKTKLYWLTKSIIFLFFGSWVYTLLFSMLPIYTTLHGTHVTELKNSSNVIMYLNENNLLHVIMYSNKNFDNNTNIRIRTVTIKFKDWKIWSTALTIIKITLIPSSISILNAFLKKSFVLSFPWYLDI